MTKREGSATLSLEGSIALRLDGSKFLRNFGGFGFAGDLVFLWSGKQVLIVFSWLQITFKFSLRRVEDFGGDDWGVGAFVDFAVEFDFAEVGSVG